LPPRNESELQYYVTLTNNCNLQCKYCYEKCCNDIGVDLGQLEIDYSIPSTINYDTGELKRFCERDQNSTIVFYGGEPLLQIDLLEDIMCKVHVNKFMIQTNGILLHKLDPEFLSKMDTILVSVDGNKDLTDYYRGKGVYDQVVSNLRQLGEKGFAGEVIARMTVGKETQIDEAVGYLLFREDLFDSVHWQLDALFWHNDYDKEGFSKWMRTEYNPRVRNLINIWITEMKDHGRVLRIYPLIGIMQSLLLNESTRLRCGAGWTMFNIQTDGNITPCPVMAGMKDFYLGNIKQTNPEDLVSRAVHVSKPCIDCSIYSICGGRCLYANVTKLWGEEGFELVCNTVQGLVGALKDVIPTIQELIAKRRISLQDFQYPKYNSCEIIP
jgi:uncharacterized protein